MEMTQYVSEIDAFGLQDLETDSEQQRQSDCAWVAGDDRINSRVATISTQPAQLSHVYDSCPDDQAVRRLSGRSLGHGQLQVNQSNSNSPWSIRFSKRLN
jgi:hypothetical protein